MINVYEQIESNKRKSFLIITLFALFVSTVILIFGYYFEFGVGYLGIALIFTGISTFFSYYYSDKIILSISGARKANKKENYFFYTVAENIALALQLPLPKLYIIEDTAPNAFATGRDPQHAVICVTTGLLNKLDRTELEAVIAHEYSHIKNYDMRLMSIVTIFVGIITLLADWFFRISFWGSPSRDREEKSNTNLIFGIIGIVLAILSPIIAQLIQFAISRRREFFADAGAILVTRQPDGLIRALQKISTDKEPLEAANKATAHLYIVNPLRNIHKAIGWGANLFNTHPPLEERIKALQAMS